MSRSRRKTPITGWTTAQSEKGWKQEMNRRRRLAERIALRNGDEILPDPVKGNYGPKDGRMYFGDDYQELMRK